MYQFSRSIYRQLAPRVIEDEAGIGGVSGRQRVLDSCEAAIRRLAYDRRYFARPARTLFNDVRMHFAMGDQLRVWIVIERNMRLALQYFEALPEGVAPGGPPRHCNAYTRRGTPCQREPLPGRRYCPSHKHLEDTFEKAEVPMPAALAGQSNGTAGRAHIAA
jgi:hypothetical protein